VPKLQRAIILHRFLHYLLYNYDGQEQTSPLSSAEFDTNSQQQQQNSRFNRTDTDIVDSVQLPPAARTFKPTAGWQCFIPPLFNKSKNSGKRAQECLFIGEILSHMPLSVFCAIIVVNYQVPGLLGLLKHPLKRHLLVKDLPAEVIAPLIYERKHVRRILANLQFLAALGLVAFAESTCKANEAANRDSQSQAVYVYKRACFYDTSTNKCASWPELAALHKLNFDPATHQSDSGGFVKYAKCEFEFGSDADVVEYWRRLVHVSMNTYKFSLVGSLKEDKQLRKKLHSFVTRKYLMDELEDVMRVEGVHNDGAIDNMGPGGYDSQLFLHYFQSWIIPCNVSGGGSSSSRNRSRVKWESSSASAFEPAITKEADQSYAPFSELALSFPFGIFRGLATVASSSPPSKVKQEKVSKSLKRKRQRKGNDNDDETVEEDEDGDYASDSTAPASPRKKPAVSINSKLTAASTMIKSKGK
jgi:general transcription factor 3C polypeptide 1